MNELAQILQNFDRRIWHDHRIVLTKVAEEGTNVELEEGDAFPILAHKPHGVVLRNWASRQVRVETPLILVICQSLRK